MRIAIAVLLLILMGSCMEDPPITPLPTPTHNGKNRLVCMMGEDAFVCDGKKSFLTVSGITFKMSRDSSVSISAENSYLMKGKLNMNFSYHPGQTFYQLNDDPNTAEAGIAMDRDGNSPTQYDTYKTNSTQTGTLTVTYFQDSTLAGTFQFDARNADGKIVHVTQGWFDIATP